MSRAEDILFWGENQDNKNRNWMTKMKKDKSEIRTGFV